MAPHLSKVARVGKTPHRSSAKEAFPNRDFLSRFARPAERIENRPAVVNNVLALVLTRSHQIA
jgi:hypothetical protein